jgi:HSP20 family molecular chaperone IbpA
MSFIQWQSWQLLNSLYQSVQEILANAPFIEESTVWVGNSGSDWISDITIRETDTEMVLQFHLPDEFANLKVQVSPETVLIQGKLSGFDVEGYFNSGYVQNLIPLPIAVHPEVVQAKRQDDMLTLILPKFGRIQQQRIAVHFADDSEPFEQASIPNVESRK